MQDTLDKQQPDKQKIKQTRDITNKRKHINTWHNEQRAKQMPDKQTLRFVCVVSL